MVGEHLEHVEWRHFWSNDNVLDVNQVEIGIGQLVEVAVLGAEENDRGFKGLLGFADDLSQSPLGCLCFVRIFVIGECQLCFINDGGVSLPFFLISLTNSKPSFERPLLVAQPLVPFQLPKPQAGSP